jgi:hypothetical protein
MRDFQQVGSASISLFAAEEPPRACGRYGYG